MDYQYLHARTMDRRVREGWAWGRSIDHATYAAAPAGNAGQERNHHGI